MKSPFEEIMSHILNHDRHVIHKLDLVFQNYETGTYHRFYIGPLEDCREVQTLPVQSAGASCARPEDLK